MPAILDQGLKRIIKEIQNLVSFVCYEAIHLRKTMSKKEMERLMGDMFLVSNKANQINHAAFFVRAKFDSRNVLRMMILDRNV